MDRGLSKSFGYGETLRGNIPCANKKGLKHVKTFALF